MRLLLSIPLFFLCIIGFTQPTIPPNQLRGLVGGGVKILSTDNSGVVSWISSSGLTGSGTTNTIPVFTSSGTLGNSGMTWSNGNLSINPANTGIMLSMGNNNNQWYLGMNGTGDNYMYGSSFNFYDKATSSNIFSLSNSAVTINRSIAYAPPNGVTMLGMGNNNNQWYLGLNGTGENYMYGSSFGFYDKATSSNIFSLSNSAVTINRSIVYNADGTGSYGKYLTYGLSGAATWTTLPPTLYSGDGTLTGLRVIYGAGYPIYFANSNIFIGLGAPYPAKLVVYNPTGTTSSLRVDGASAGLVIGSANGGTSSISQSNSLTITDMGGNSWGQFTATGLNMNGKKVTGGITSGATGSDLISVTQAKTELGAKHTAVTLPTTGNYTETFTPQIQQTIRYNLTGRSTDITLSVASPTAGGIYIFSFFNKSTGFSIFTSAQFLTPDGSAYGLLANSLTIAGSVRFWSDGTNLYSF